MSITSRITKAAAATAVAGAALFTLVGTAPAAQAAPAGCNAGGLCVYWSSNYSGSVQTVYQDNNDLSMYANFKNSQGGSAFNNGNSCNVVVYAQTNAQGQGWILYRGQGWNVIGDNLPSILSNRWCTV
ncbi:MULTISPECIES: peptidase inhibitor family I36 protein [Kitasatospora]|uniref:Peptidase inhibitor family I36 protein n=1 Tax=Kitasatospora cathayae TaxID=3004092 RepID=A0ABY7QF79_9ACTN|nr:peptidase inhibitor family I36 protein [Kitasatospora sp. HUAS 3-15]WBP91340.1 peptidase inhibitor family I36 protein [Kitasatospora sp. HUAS 3-15]